MLTSLSKTIPVSELVGDIKRDSSKWIKTQGKEFRDFHWQEGYGAFSVGQTQVKEVMKYIARQKEHHAQRNFEDEFRYFFAEVRD